MAGPWSSGIRMTPLATISPAWPLQKEKTMDTPHPDLSLDTPPRADALPRRRERRRPVTTQESREYALHDAILTDKGFQQGYVVLKPGRWLWRVWLEFERFNDALQRVETQTFTLLGNRQTDFLPHIQALQ